MLSLGSNINFKEGVFRKTNGTRQNYNSQKVFSDLLIFILTSRSKHVYEQTADLFDAFQKQKFIGLICKNFRRKIVELFVDDPQFARRRVCFLMLK